MRGYFEQACYPIVGSYDEIVGFLRQPDVRAVVYRNEADQAAHDFLKQSVSAPRVCALAQAFSSTAHYSARPIYAGKSRFLEPFSRELVAAEAQSGGIVIAPEALDLLTERLAAIRSLYLDVYQATGGDPAHETAGHLLFTPKGGDGRAPKMHVDYLPLTCHWAFALAPLDIMTEEPDEHLWTMLNRVHYNKLDEPGQLACDQWLTEVSETRQADFAYSVVGDIIFSKGQRFRDLSKAADRAQVCVHKSSNLIPHMGQAAALFYPILPRGLGIAG